MGKKKPFIDKKNASVYHLVRRSQRDVGGYYDEQTGEPLDVPREFVLMPTPETQEKIHKLKQKQSTYSVDQVYDRQEDDDDDDAMNGHGLTMTAQDALARAKARLQAANLVDDYDYERHMMPISGNGAFISVDGRAQVDPFMDVRSRNVPILDEPMIKEVDRQLESIAITADCMDEDVAEALFNFQEGEFEELLDDFCLTAAQEPDQEEEGGGEGGDGNGAFDFDAHIERLIAKARMEENGGCRVMLDNHEAWVKSASEFKGVKPYRKHQGNDLEDDDYDDEEDEYYHDDNVNTGHDLYSTTMDVNPGVVAKLNPEEEKALCEKFEQTLMEYDSDDVGDLDDDYMNIRGDKPLEGDVQIEAALDQFLQEKKDENFIAGTRHLQKRQGGCSKVYVNKKLVPFNALDAQEIKNGPNEEEEEKEQEPNVYEMLAEAEKILANPEMDLPPEEILIDGKSYFTMKERNPWDCESILSTYSNLDNNPAIIGRSTTNRRRKKKSGNKNINDDVSTIHEEQQPVQILLSNKTGLPLGVLPERPGGHKHNRLHDLDDFDQQETFVSVNKGVARKKNETAEERKARKKAVKEERQVARIQKKMMKEAIHEEFAKRTGNVDVDDVAGKSVFRYS
jgi:protein LTV1